MATSPPDSAPYLLRHIEPGDVGDQSYIVKLKPNVKTEDYIANLRRGSNTSEPEDLFKQLNDKVFHGFYGILSDSLLERLLTDQAIEYIEEDPVLEVASIITQEGAPWGLQRIGQNVPLTDITGIAQAQQLEFTYKYDESAGEGCDIYVLDSGINTDHAEFEGRARWGHTVQGTPGRDFTGHGTHVAGIAAGKTYGVAKKANLIAVKVFDDRNRGRDSHAIAGLDWVFMNTDASERPSIVNLSVNSLKTRAFNEAIQNCVAFGIHVVGAAGNRGEDASNYSPASCEECITVGAVNYLDERIDLSNYGPAVDMWAPGIFITSAWIDGDTSHHVMGGTSQACPHVAGLIACIISSYGHNPEPYVMKGFLKAISIQSAKDVGEGGNKSVARSLIDSPLTDASVRGFFEEAADIKRAAIEKMFDDIINSPPGGHTGKDVGN